MHQFCHNILIELTFKSTLKYSCLVQNCLVKYLDSNHTKQRAVACNNLLAWNFGLVEFEFDRIVAIVPV